MYGPPGTGKTLFAKVKIPGWEGDTGFFLAPDTQAAFVTGSQSTAFTQGLPALREWGGVVYASQGWLVEL